MTQCCFTPEKVNEAFLQAPPLIAQKILDLSIQHPRWLRDIFEVEDWPNGNGTIMEQLVYRAGRPQIERGFDKWKKISNLSGCEPCNGPDCGYHWTMFGGHGFERKLTELMQREFRSPDYCINEIQTTAHFKEVFAKIVENLYAQVDFFKEMNIAHNFLTAIAKKYVVDGDGAKCNPQNPYVYRNIGEARLSTLGMGLLEFFYEHMTRIPDAVPYDVVDGAPIYSMLASRQLLSRMFRDDPNLRQDVRFSGFANELLTKYNFMSTIRGMFIAAPIMWPRRFNSSGDDGVPVEVLPYVNNVPAEVGEYTYINPAYEEATHEEVLLHGRHPFKVFQMPTETSLPGGATFGPGFTFMNNWAWVNPMTVSDPFRRVGFFATEAKIGLSQQFSDGVFGVLVERPTKKLMASYVPEPNPIPTPVVIDNSVPDVGCPCPLILTFTASAFDANNYIVTFATPVTGEAEDPVQLELDNGMFIEGTLVQVSTDGKTAEISFTTPLEDGACTRVVGIYCDDSLGCSATVVNACDCRAAQLTAVKLVLSNAIKANEADDVILAYFGDCTTAELDVVSVDAAKLEWTVRYNTGFGPTDDPNGDGGGNLNADLICDRGGITRVCVPPATDASCPACEVTVEACEETTTT